MDDSLTAGFKNGIRGTDEDNYKKRILVTGGAGFIGSNTVIWFVQRYPEYYIVNLDKLEYSACLKNLECIKGNPNYKFIQGDICDMTFLQKVFQEEKIDTVLHFAAQSHVDNSFGSPTEFTHTNVCGTHTLLQVAHEANVNLFIHMSTDEVYGGNSKVTLKEDAPFQPTNPYAASKAAAECILKSYWEGYKMPIIITRANNLYGPHQHPEKVIPKFISMITRNKKCPVYGDGLCRRNFLHIDDFVRAFDTLLHHGVAGEVYNIGTDFSLSVIDLARYLIKKLKHDDSESLLDQSVAFVEDRPFHDFTYPIDSRKIHGLGWKPRIPWEEGIDRTISWYLSNLDNWEVSDESLKGIPNGVIAGV